MASARNFHRELISDFSAIWLSGKNFSPTRELIEGFLEEVVPELSLAGREKVHQV